MLCSATKSSMVPRLTAYILLILIDSWLVHVSLLCRCFSSARGERLEVGDVVRVPSMQVSLLYCKRSPKEQRTRKRRDPNS